MKILPRLRRLTLHLSASKRARYLAELDDLIQEGERLLAEGQRLRTAYPNESHEQIEGFMTPIRQKLVLLRTERARW